MTVNSISSLSASYLQVLTNSASTKADQASLSLPQDSSSDISPVARFLSQLQQIQQQDPAKFQQITSKIAGRLRDAATAAQKQGNSSQADQLNQLADQFQQAADTGQVPTAQALQQAGLSGHHHGGSRISNLFQQSTSDSDSPSLLSTLLTTSNSNTTS
jgi:hypothetical protein